VTNDDTFIIAESLGNDTNEDDLLYFAHISKLFMPSNELWYAFPFPKTYTAVSSHCK
jgi:hypothetical protein